MNIDWVRLGIWEGLAILAIVALTYAIWDKPSDRVQVINGALIGFSVTCVAFFAVWLVMR